MNPSKTLLFAIVFTAITGSYALAAEPLFSSDSRIKLLQYDESDVYTITTRYGYQTNIVFGQGEDIQTISVGDRSLWQLIPSGNRLFIRPMEYGAETNMTLITNKHSYQFDLKSLAEGKQKGNLYVARFVYPEDEAKRAAKMASVKFAPPFAQPAPIVQPAPAHIQPAPVQPPNTEPEPVVAEAAPAPPAHTEPEPAAVAETKPDLTAAPTVQPAPLSSSGASKQPGLNYNYTYAGPDDAAPIKAYDDGKSTFIQYRKNQPLPGITMIGTDGEEVAVSYSVSDNLMIIEAVAGEWRLEGNNGTVSLYNEILNPQ